MHKSRAQAQKQHGYRVFDGIEPIPHAEVRGAHAEIRAEHHAPDHRGYAAHAQELYHIASAARRLDFRKIDGREEREQYAVTDVGEHHAEKEKEKRGYMRIGVKLTVFGSGEHIRHRFIGSHERIVHRQRRHVVPLLRFDKIIRKAFAALGEHLVHPVEKSERYPALQDIRACRAGSCAQARLFCVTHAVMIAHELEQGEFFRFFCGAQNYLRAARLDLFRPLPYRFALLDRRPRIFRGAGGKLHLRERRTHRLFVLFEANERQRRLRADAVSAPNALLAPLSELKFGRRDRAYRREDALCRREKRKRRPHVDKRRKRRERIFAAQLFRRAFAQLGRKLFQLVDHFLRLFFALGGGEKFVKRERGLRQEKFFLFRLVIYYLFFGKFARLSLGVFDKFKRKFEIRQFQRQRVGVLTHVGSESPLFAL